MKYVREQLILKKLIIESITKEQFIEGIKIYVEENR